MRNFHNYKVMVTLQPDTEKQFLKDYNPNDFDRPSTAVDSVIYSVFDDELHVLIVKRANHPFRDYWSLVGGYVDLQNDTDLIDTAMRKLIEKTGVKTPYLEQFNTIGNKTRDPRGWSITTVYFALLPVDSITLEAGHGAQDIKWAKLTNGKVKEKLAFDHDAILKACTKRLRDKVLYTSLPIHLMPEKFTLNGLQRVYEIIIDNKIDHKSFRRRLLNADILEETGEMQKTGRRPAMLYKLKKSNETFFFLRNLEGSQ